MTQFKSRWLAPLMLAAVSGNVFAVDGVVLIDQNRALAGGVTPGDAPGFPVTISLPGSYRLTGNLRVPDADTTAIVINAGYVTLDLNGFSIIGTTNCAGYNPVTSCSPTGTGKGVNVTGAWAGITVLNGIVRGMGSDGVSAANSSGLIQNIYAENNGGSGIHAGTASVIGNRAIGNGVYGIYMNIESIGKDNIALGNGLVGIVVLCPGVVVGNVADFNGGGANLITAGPASCVAANNSAP